MHFLSQLNASPLHFLSPTAPVSRLRAGLAPVHPCVPLISASIALETLQQTHTNLQRRRRTVRSCDAQQHFLTLHLLDHLRYKLLFSENNEQKVVCLKQSPNGVRQIINHIQNNFVFIFIMCVYIKTHTVYILKIITCIYLIYNVCIYIYIHHKYTQIL